VTEYPITPLDLVVMKVYPFRCCLGRNTSYYDAHEFALDNFIKDDFTWVTPKYYFKNEEDYIWFSLRWS
jgi:hypothetical protein